MEGKSQAQNRNVAAALIKAAASPADFGAQFDLGLAYLLNKCSKRQLSPWNGLRNSDLVSQPNTEISGHGHESVSEKGLYLVTLRPVNDLLDLAIGRVPAKIPDTGCFCNAKLVPPLLDGAAR